jgi:lipopolysaccharide/colanic/teichoic acid biosynthesis glycosyltransferase
VACPSAAVPDPLQRALAILGSIVTAPLVAILAALVVIDDPGSPFFLAERVGRGGRPFRLIKLRSMRAMDPDRSSPITAAGDARVTRMGALLRRTRLDELPQLWNVVLGDMRLVGPRPEDPRFVDRDDPLHRVVFGAVPGITGLTQLLFVDEAERLDPTDPEGSYRRSILPEKVGLDAAYLERRSTALDAWILVRTVLALAGRPTGRAEVIARIGAEPRN